MIKFPIGDASPEFFLKSVLSKRDSAAGRGYKDETCRKWIAKNEKSLVLNQGDSTITINFPEIIRGKSKEAEGYLVSYGFYKISVML